MGEMGTLAQDVSTSDPVNSRRFALSYGGEVEVVVVLVVAVVTECRRTRGRQRLDPELPAPLQHQPLAPPGLGYVLDGRADRGRKAGVVQTDRARAQAHGLRAGSSSNKRAVRS